MISAETSFARLEALVASSGARYTSTLKAIDFVLEDGRVWCFDPSARDRSFLPRRAGAAELELHLRAEHLESLMGLGVSGAALRDMHFQGDLNALVALADALQPAKSMLSLRATSGTPTAKARRGS